MILGMRVGGVASITLGGGIHQARQDSNAIIIEANWFDKNVDCVYSVIKRVTGEATDRCTNKIGNELYKSNDE
jgi:hypothetical protein